MSDLIRNVLHHFRDFWKYYVSAVPVRYQSSYSATESRERLLALNAAGDVDVRFRRNGNVEMSATAHARPTRGTPIIPILKGTIANEGDRVSLEGTIGLDAGVRVFILIFGAFLLSFVIVPGKQSFPGAIFIAVGVYLGVLICAYVYGQRDVQVIVTQLSHALGDPNVTGHQVVRHTGADATTPATGARRALGREDTVQGSATQAGVSMSRSQAIGTIIIVLLSLLVANKLARSLSDYVVLNYHYGGERVAKESLKVADAGRVELRISNGDVLNKRLAHTLHGIFAISMLIFTSILVVVLSLGVKRIAPWAAPPRL